MVAVDVRNGIQTDRIPHSKSLNDAALSLHAHSYAAVSKFLNLEREDVQQRGSTEKCSKGIYTRKY